MSCARGKFRVGILPGIADLYIRALPGLQERLNEFVEEVVAELQSEGLEVFSTAAVNNGQLAAEACKKLESEDIDLLIVALAPYCPSGILAPVLEKVSRPVLLWPAQKMFSLEPERYDKDTTLLNHGVHGVQDLANVLGKSDKAFGVIHGHLRQKEFRDELDCWVRAGRAICAMSSANPLQVGGHFDDMLDLQIGEDEFVKKMGLKPRVVSQDKFSQLLGNISEGDIKRCIERYRVTFDIADDVDDALLSKAAKGESALRTVMSKENSFACGLNFLALCNDERIADGLHVAASILMQEGFGYAGEGDWVTATMVYGMQEGFGAASFSEIFSVGYADNRLVLRHWGEGNFAMARAKPKLVRSEFIDKNKAEFAVVDFEFESGDATLINLNSTAGGQGQLISICGCITDDSLPKAPGPRAVFKPVSADVRELLSEYAYCGGSHHLALVKGDGVKVLEKISRLTGWSYVKL